MTKTYKEIMREITELEGKYEALANYLELTTTTNNEELYYKLGEMYQEIKNLKTLVEE